jgi:hypothetical protein
VAKVNAVCWPLAIVSLAVLGQQQPLSGTVSGTVVDASSRRPLARVAVRLSAEGQDGGPLTISDEEGRFVFERVADGRFVIAPAAAEYVRPRWAPGQPPHAVVVRSGQQVSGITVLLQRGGAIAGVVRDEHSRPIDGARVVLLQCVGFVACNGASVRQLRTSGTDERGRYRFFGIPAGRYLLGVDAPLADGTRPIVRPGADEIREASRILSAGRGSLPESAPGPRALAALATYFPDSTVLSRAEMIDVGDGETRDGIDVTVKTGPVAIVSGTVLGVNDDPVPDATVSIFPAEPRPVGAIPTLVRAAPAGRFATSSLPPGAYRLVARFNGRLRAEVIVNVDGHDIDNVILRPRPGLVLAGRIVVGAGAKGMNPAGVIVELRRTDTAVLVSNSDVVSTASRADGTFTLEGLLPGHYAIGVHGETGDSTWWFASARFDGRDVLESGLSVTDDSAGSSLVITVSATPTRVYGDVRYEDQRPASEFLVVAFPADKALWSADSRRLMIRSVAAGGSYELRGLPAGEYLVGLVGVDSAADVDRHVLELLAGQAHHVTVQAGEARRIDFQAR